MLGGRGMSMSLGLIPSRSARVGENPSVCSMQELLVPLSLAVVSERGEGLMRRCRLVWMSRLEALLVNSSMTIVYREAVSLRRSRSASLSKFCISLFIK